MADVKLSDGREMDVDLMKMTFKEYQAILMPSQNDADGSEILGRCVGLTGEELDNLPLPDYKRVVQAVVFAARQPVPDDDEKN
jgi:hypothetical protein